MTNDEHEAAAKNDTRSFLIKACSLFAEMGPETMKNVLIFSGKHPYNMSEESLGKHTGDLMEEDPKRFCKIMDNPIFHDAVFIHKCVNQGLLTKTGSGYSQDGSVIGTSLEFAISFLNNPVNQSLKIALLAALQEREEGGKRTPITSNLPKLKAK